MKKGVLGKITKCTNPYEVDWTPHTVGRSIVSLNQVVKCNPCEFLAVGDIVKAADDLQY